MKRLVFAVALLAAAAACGRDRVSQARQMTGGDPERGKSMIRQYGCGGCHEIPGVDGADAMVGPPLSHMANRVYLAGKVANTPDNMRRWIMNPQGIDPKNAMPNLGVTEKDSRDITAYLYTLQ